MRSVFPARRLLIAALAICTGPALSPNPARAQDKSNTAVQDRPNSAIKAEPRPGQWMRLHESFLERAKKKDVDLLFLGDSITQGWSNNAVWKRHYEPRNAANFGIGGDRTQHVLWRIENGEIEGISPRVAVLMIGTNNISSNSPEEIAEGVKAIVTKLRDKLPETKVLLLGVFPRGAKRDKTAETEKPADQPGQINAIISKLDDGKTVRYLDIGKVFLDDEGNIPRSLMPDFLHLSVPGYRKWADAIEPTLWEMMQ